MTRTSVVIQAVAAHIKNVSPAETPALAAAFSTMLVWATATQASVNAETNNAAPKAAAAQVVPATASATAERAPTLSEVCEIIASLMARPALGIKRV